MWSCTLLHSSTIKGRVSVHGAGFVGIQHTVVPIPHVLHATVEVSIGAVYAAYEAKKNASLHGDSARSLCLALHC